MLIVEHWIREVGSWTEISGQVWPLRKILATVKPKQGYGKSSTEMTVWEKIHD